MNKIFKTILLSSVLVFAAGFLAAALPANATMVQELIVEWSTDQINWQPLTGPIFNETNFLPGQDVIRFIRATNNSPSIQRIAIEAINKNDPDNFASQLNLTIKEGATIIFDKTLADFFSQGETYLSSLGIGQTTQYSLTISFNSASGNLYQEKTLGFDILVGFEGTEGGLILPEQGGGNNLGGGGGGGGGSPPGLIIQNESVASSTYTNVTITWLTSYPATSQVLYAQEGEPHTLNLIDDSGAPPKYGYAHTTPESDNPANMHGVLSHSVTIFGLTPGTKYYYRAVSHGSFAVSEEHNFNTLSVNSASANSAIGETPSRGGNGGQVLSEENLGVAENIGNSGNIGTAATSFNGNVSGNTSATPKNLFATIIGALSFNWELIIALSIIAFILIIWGLFRKKEED